MRPEEARHFMHSVERQLRAAGRVVHGTIDAASAHEYIAATEAEQEARNAVLGRLEPASPRTSSRSRSS